MIGIFKYVIFSFELFLPSQKRPNDMSKELWTIIAACLFAKKPKYRPSIKQILDAPFFTE